MASLRSHERPEKILVAMLDLSGGSTKPLKYEDIVVKAFKLFPDEFALRGYPEFPDSSDIHKPLYGPLKREGFVRSANKTFALTPRGIDQAERLARNGARPGAASRSEATERLPRDLAAEVDRMLGSAAARLFAEQQDGRILDTDFYAFVGCTVRTPRNDFLGRVRSTAVAVEAAASQKQPSPEASRFLRKLWSHLEARFADLIERRRRTA